MGGLLNKQTEKRPRDQKLPLLFIKHQIESNCECECVSNQFRWLQQFVTLSKQYIYLMWTNRMNSRRYRHRWIHSLYNLRICQNAEGNVFFVASFVSHRSYLRCLRARAHRFVFMYKNISLYFELLSVI